MMEVRRLGLEMVRVEEVKTYSFNKEGFKRAQVDLKASKFGNALNLGIYIVLVIMLINGKLTKDFVFKYITGIITSRFVKCIIKQQ